MAQLRPGAGERGVPRQRSPEIGLRRVPEHRSGVRISLIPTKVSQASAAKLVRLLSRLNLESTFGVLESYAQSWPRRAGLS